MSRPRMDSSLPLTPSTSFLFHLAQSVSVSHVSFCISLLLPRVSTSSSSLSPLFPAPVPFSSLSLSLLRPRPPSRPIMLPYCLGILSLTPKPVQIASGFARTCMSAPLSVRRRRSLSLGTRKGRKDANLTGNNMIALKAYGRWKLGNSIYKSFDSSRTHIYIYLWKRVDDGIREAKEELRSVG